MNRCLGDVVTVRVELIWPCLHGGPATRTGRDLAFRRDQLGEIGDKLAAFMAEHIAQRITGLEQVELHITIEPATCAVFAEATS